MSSRAHNLAKQELRILFSGHNTKKETDMDMKDYWLGFVSGTCATFVVSLLVSVIHFVADHDYKDRLTIEYNNNENEYERKIVLDMINSSNIQTNFLNKDYHYGKYTVKYVLTNPK